MIISIFLSPISAVEALSRSHDANNTAQHTVYTCDGSEKNMTECDSEEEAFICKLTGALRCEGLALMNTVMYICTIDCTCILCKQSQRTTKYVRRVMYSS